MTYYKTLIWAAILLPIGCVSKKQIYADRLVDNRNRHLYVNDKLDFSISYFDVISKRNRQTDSLDLKKTSVPPLFQKHLTQTIKRPSEILFHAHRSSMSDEDILAVLYSNKGNLQDFSKTIVSKLLTFVPKDSIRFQPYETSTGYLLNVGALKDAHYRGSDFIQPRAYNVLTYKVLLNNTRYKFHEFHVPYNDKLILRLIWIANIDRTVKNTKLDWEKIDEQNHHLELFSLDDSASFRLKEVVPDNPFKIAQDAFKEYGYSGAVNTLLDYENTVATKGNYSQKSMYYQALMTYYSFLGDNKKSLEYLDKAFPANPKPVTDSVFMDSKAIDAAAYILQSIDTHRIVMINEAHNCGQHRAFLRDILRGGYEKGFRYLSLEDLSKTDSINERGYPLREKSGFYNLEPTFSQALREALSLGFTLIGHDDYSEKREEGQAANIHTILEKDPAAKILVWAGHSHIQEKPIGNRRAWMAYHFKNLTGIDPLTIETTTLREHSKPEHESGYYRAALKKWGLNKPFVIQMPNDSAFVVPDLRGIVDMQVVFPRTEYPNDYPHWMGNAETTFYELDIDKDYFKDKLLKIFLQKEYAKEVEAAIPIMNIPLSRTGVFKLFLKPDKYVAVIRDVANWEYLYKEFEVKQE